MNVNQNFNRYIRQANYYNQQSLHANNQAQQKPLSKSRKVMRDTTKSPGSRGDYQQPPNLGDVSKYGNSKNPNVSTLD